MDEGYISKVNILQARLEYRNLKKQLETFIKCAEYGLSEFETVSVVNRNGKETKQKVKLPNPEFQIQYVKKLPLGLEDVKAKLFMTTGMTIDLEDKDTQIELDKIKKQFNY